MLGDILARLADPTQAEAALRDAGGASLLARLPAGEPVGQVVATRVRHFLDHADEEAWLGLMGRMANTPEPAIAALRIILARSLAGTA